MDINRLSQQAAGVHTSGVAGSRLSKGRLRAELWDKLHFILSDCTDRMIRGEFRYDGLIDVDILKQALQHVVEAHPVLHSAFIDSAFRPYWAIQPYTIDDILTVVDVTDVADGTDGTDGTDRLEKVRYDFMNQVIPADHNVQLKVALINHKGKSMLCVLANHMCMDGMGSYTIFAQMAHAYTALQKGQPMPVIKMGSRSASMVYSRMSLWNRLGAWLLLKNISRLKEKRTFAFEKEDATDSLQIVTQKWSLEDTDNIREVAKRKKVTVNDVLLSCYAHALCETSDFPEGRPFTVTCMVDNRKYIKPSATIGLTNHVGLLQLKMNRCEPTIRETLRSVHNLTKREKNKRYFGLVGIPLIGLGYVLPFFIVKPGTRLWFTPPVLGFSNLGVIPHEPLTLGEVALEDIMVMAPAQYKQHLTIAIQTMHNRLLFGAAVRGSEKDKEKIQDLFVSMRKHMRELLRSEE